MLWREWWIKRGGDGGGFGFSVRVMRHLILVTPRFGSGVSSISGCSEGSNADSTIE